MSDELRQLTLFDAVEIPLPRGHTTFVDSIDADLASRKWNVHRARDTSPPYVTKHHSAYTELMHRTILSRMLNRDLLPDEKVDHIDGDSLNNRRSNLRLATHANNMWNVKRKSTNKSGYKGVSWKNWIKTGGKWAASITINRKRIHLGYFNTREEAHHAYCEAARKYHGEFARTE